MVQLLCLGDIQNIVRKMQNYLLPESVLKWLISYLSSKPFNEVQEAIHLLKSLQKIEAKPVDKKD